MYANSEYYAGEFYGSAQEPAICESDREMYLKRASAFLDSLFLHKKPEEPYIPQLKDACCEIADCFYTFGKREGISSENNDGYSVSFFDSRGCGAESRAYVIAARYLTDTGLLYRGV